MAPSTPAEAQLIATIFAFARPIILVRRANVPGRSSHSMLSCFVLAETMRFFSVAMMVPSVCLVNRIRPSGDVMSITAMRARGHRYATNQLVYVTQTFAKRLGEDTPILQDALQMRSPGEIYMKIRAAREVGHKAPHPKRRARANKSMR